MQLLIKRYTGFTLLEVVVAVAIFAIIASITFPTLIQFLEARERIDERNQHVLSLQKAFLFLQKDLRYSLGRKLKDEYGEASDYKFDTGHSGDYLLRITALYPDVNIGNVSVPRMVIWKLEDNNLVRLQWPVFEPYIATQPYKQVVLSEVQNVDFRYAKIDNGQLKWNSAWNDNEGMPKAAEVIITVKTDDSELEYRRLFEMTGFNDSDIEEGVDAP